MSRQIRLCIGSTHQRASQTAPLAYGGMQDRKAGTASLMRCLAPCCLAWRESLLKAPNAGTACVRYDRDLVIFIRNAAIGVLELQVLVCRTN